MSWPKRTGVMVVDEAGNKIGSGATYEEALYGRPRGGDQSGRAKARAARSARKRKRR